MVEHFEWRVESVPAANKGSFAEQLQDTLNTMENAGFAIDDIMDAPEGRQTGVVVIAKKPRPLPGASGRSPQTGP